MRRRGLWAKHKGLKQGSIGNRSSERVGKTDRARETVGWDGSVGDRRERTWMDGWMTGRMDGKDDHPRILYK